MQNKPNIAGDRATRRSVFARLRADQRGAALLEFAFVAPILLALLLAIVDTNLQFFAQQCLQTTGEKTARLLLTGSAKSSNLSKGAFKTEVCNRLPAFMDCSKVIVEVRRAASFETLDMSGTTMTTDANGNPNASTRYDLGNPGDIVMLRVMYLWPIRFAPLGFGQSSQNFGGQRVMISTSVMKTEPYS